MNNWREFMEWLVVLCLILSTINFYFLTQNMIKKSFDSELQEFRSYTESLITEFNRITTRNVELLDSRIEDLNHKIRLSQKIDHLLKERFEEANKIEYLKPLQMDKVHSLQTLSSDPVDTHKKILSIDHTITDDMTIEHIILDNIQQNISTPIDEESTNSTNNDQEISTEPTINPIALEPSNPDEISTNFATNLLFEGIPIEKIKKHRKNSRANLEKEQQLIQYIKHNKSKDELLELGFTSNEINIAMLYYSTTDNYST